MKPFINVVVDDESWCRLLEAVPVRQRYSQPDKYVTELIDNCGRPMYFDLGWCDMHAYPPDRRIKR